MLHLTTQLPANRARFFLLLLVAVALFSAPRASFAQYVLNSQEALLADLLVHDRGQTRGAMRLDPILAQVARERAADMATRNYFAHVNPDGLGPNALVRAAGYSLPNWWGTAATENFIESLAAGRSSAGETWADLLASTPHRTHLLATDSFYRNQTSYGVGYATASGNTYRHYWVIITAPPNSTVGDAALFISQDLPAAMTTGHDYAVSVAMLNTGANTWTQSAGYHLRSTVGSAAWALSRVNLPSSVNPGGAVTFNFVVIAPGSPGTSPFQWQMSRDSTGPFGEQSPLRNIPFNDPPRPVAAYVAPPSSSSSASSSSKSKKKKKKKSKKKKKKKSKPK